MTLQVGYALRHSESEDRLTRIQTPCFRLAVEATLSGMLGLGHGGRSGNNPGFGVNFTDLFDEVSSLRRSSKPQDGNHNTDYVAEKDV